MINLNYWQAGIFVFCALALIQSLFLTIVLGIRTKKNPSLLFLIVMLIGLGLRIGKSIYSHVWTEKVYWGVWLGCIGLWLIGAGIHCYVRKRHYDRLSTLDKLTFIPSVLLLIAYDNITMEQVNWAYRIGTMELGLILFFHMVYMVKRSSISRPSKLLLILSVIEIAFVIQLATGTIEWYVGGSIISCLALYFLNYLIIKKDIIFKGVNGSHGTANYKVLEHTLAKMDLLLTSEHIYKQKGLTVSTVANLIETPAYLISQSIKYAKKRNFNHWVNSFRVSAVKQVLRDPNRNDKVEHLAEEFGFSGVSSLYTAFKEETGKTLKAYKDEVS